MTDREKVIRAVDSIFDYWLVQHRCLHSLELENVRQLKADAIDLLKEQEAVVRCKDCKHFDCSRLYKCRIHGSLFQPKDKNWFCADGERKEGGEMG